MNDGISFERYRFLPDFIRYAIRLYYTCQVPATATFDFSRKTQTAHQPYEPPLKNA
jgi:hypothetical protein